MLEKVKRIFRHQTKPRRSPTSGTSRLTQRISIRQSNENCEILDRRIEKGPWRSRAHYIETQIDFILNRDHHKKRKESDEREK